MRPATSHGSRCTLITRLGLILAMLAGALALPISPGVRADTLVVEYANNAGPGSLRQAIADAASGDTITFASNLSGGTIYAGSPLVLDKDLTIDGSALAEPVTLSGNGAVRVMEVMTDTAVTLHGLVIADGMADDDAGGTAPGYGGGVYSRGTLTVIDCTFSDNSAAMLGGAINSTGALTVVDSTFIGNTGIEAGAIANWGALTVSGSTFSANSALAGGGIACGSPAMVTNSTFYGNTAELFGGGIAANADCALTLSHCTFSGNAVIRPDYGGTITTLGVLNYTHTIVANSHGRDCRLLEGGTVALSVNNLVEDGSCSATWDGDPLLGPLADHGGPTHTMALLPGSPALNAGDASTCPAATDQRGVARPQGAGCDLGAYEQELPAASTEAASDITPTGATLQGVVNARNSPTTVIFAYGLDTGYGLTATVPSAVTGTVDTAVSAVLADLTPATTYHYRVVAENEAGIAFGADRTLTTAAVAPTAVTEYAIDVTATGATLHGVVNAHDSATTVTFAYGLDTSYPMSVTVPSAVTGMADTAVSAAVAGLTPGRTYHYRVVAVNAGGVSYGGDATFTTLPPPGHPLYLPAIRR